MSILAIVLAVSLQGTVIKAGGDEPVVKATIELKRTDGSDSRVRTASTANNGSFVFNDLPAAEYQLTVSHPGYVKAEYGEKRPEGPGIPIKIGSDPVTVRMTLTPTAAIAGRILDGRGQPLGNATVQAMKKSYSGGKEHLAEVQSVISDDRGEYRLFYLTPGKYYVSATPVVDLRSVGSNGSDTVTQFRIQREQTVAQPVPSADLGVPIYFPGTPDMLAAAAIDLKPGGETRSIDIIAAPVHTRHIRGVVVDYVTGQPVPGGVAIRLAHGDRTSYRGFPTSTFDLPQIEPGAYFIGATVGSLSGKIPIEVFDRDIDNLTIPVSSAFTVSGRVIIEGVTADNPGPEMKTLHVLTRSEPNDGAQIDTPTPGADGSFRLPNVPSGTYRVSISPALQNAYLKSVRLGTEEGMRNGITLQGPPSGPLEIVISASAGKIEGRILNEKQQVLPNTTVVLVPDTALRSRNELFKNAKSTVAGDFKLTGITPGNYTLFAWEEVEPGSWLNSDFLKAYEERGTPVKITEGAALKLDLHALPQQY